ncbi:MAG: hypothetical protein HZA22_14100 [Nitrospirae bacterium]|nr:hypothetical protein [Nitrospirota bacterium]
MQSVTIMVSDAPDSRELIRHALERERKADASSLAATEKKVRLMAKSLGVKVTGLDKVERTEENELQLVELEGEIGILGRLKERRKRLDSMVVCD